MAQRQELMSNHNNRSKADTLFVAIADYVHDFVITREHAFKMAQIVLLDSLGCAVLGAQEPECCALLGPVIKGTYVPMGARVPGTAFVLDPIKAAFDIGICIRWLDYNDTWLAREWGHPSDNIGGILAVSDFLGVRMQDVLIAMIKAHEIQGVLALDNAFNALGFDHVILVKLATTAVVSKLLGLSKSQTIDAISQVWVDGCSLRIYRHAPNTGPRKSWAAGDATARGVQLAWLTKLGTSGYPSALSEKHWGFSDVYFEGEPLILPRSFESYVMENILFKTYAAEFHAQTAIECAVALCHEVQANLNSVKSIVIKTQASAMRIINKTGPLHNHADRDHCLQYMVAIALLYGGVEPYHYSGAIASDPRIDTLRLKMQVSENPKFTLDYLDSTKRSIGNSIQVFFQDGTQSQKITIDYPLGHPYRRAEAMPCLQRKYAKTVESGFRGQALEQKRDVLLKQWEDLESWLHMPVHIFMDAWALPRRLA